MVVLGKLLNVLACCYLAHHRICSTRIATMLWRVCRDKPCCLTSRCCRKIWMVSSYSSLAQASGENLSEQILLQGRARLHTHMDAKVDPLFCVSRAYTTGIRLGFLVQLQFKRPVRVGARCTPQS